MANGGTEDLSAKVNESPREESRAVNHDEAKVKEGQGRQESTTESASSAASGDTPHSGVNIRKRQTQSTRNGQETKRNAATPRGMTRGR